MMGQYLAEIHLFENLRVQKINKKIKDIIYLFIEKITFKYVQIKFLSMHINNLKFTFCVYTVGSFKI